MANNILNFEIGAELSKLDRDLNKATKSISDFAERNKKSFDKVGNAMQTFGKKISVVSAGLSALGGLAVNEFGKIDKGLREVNSLFGLTGEAAEKNFGDLASIAKEASSEIGILQSDVVPGLYNSISAGVPKDNVLDFIKIAGKAAIGGVTDLNTSVDGLTSIINAFGKEFSEAGAVADSVFAAVQGGKTTFEELASSIFNIAPAAAASKVSMEEVNAAIATLTASGTPTKVATTQIRAALVGLQRPSEEMDDIFQKLGFQNAQLAIESKGLKFALEAVKEASGGNNGALQQLLGSVEAVAAANVLAGTGSQKFSDELERQANAAGAAELAFLELEKSFPRQLERLKVQFNNIAIEIGQKLAPFVLKLNSALSKLLKKWDNLSDGSKNLILILGGVVAALGPALIALGALVKLIPVLIKGFALLVSPIGLVALAIGALTAVVVKNWSTIKRWAEDVVNYFISLYNESIVFRAGVEAVVFQFKLMLAVGKFVFNSLYKIISGVLGTLVKQLSAFGTILKGVLTFDTSTIKAGLSDYQKNLSNGLGTIISGVKSEFNNLTDSLSSNLQTSLNNILGGKKEPVNFTSSKESADELSEDVEEAVSLGVANGLSGGGQGREQAQTAGVGLQSEGLQGGGILDQVREGLQPAMEFIDVQFEILKNRFEEFRASMAELIAGSITDTFMSLGDAIGNALANGTNVIQAMGQSLLQSMGKFLSNFGDQLIKYAVAAKAFSKLQLALANPVTGIVSAGVALAAGLALKAFGGAISSSASGGIGGSVGGGGASASTPSVSTSSIGRTAIANENNFVFRISGRDLVSVIDKNRSNNDRIGG